MLLFYLTSRHVIKETLFIESTTARSRVLLFLTRGSSIFYKKIRRTPGDPGGTASGDPSELRTNRSSGPPAWLTTGPRAILDGPTALAPWNHESQGDPRGRETERKTHGQRKGFIWKNCVVKTELWNLEEIVNLRCRTLRWYANLRIREMRWRKGDGWT